VCAATHASSPIHLSIHRSIHLSRATKPSCFALETPPPPPPQRRYHSFIHHWWRMYVLFDRSRVMTPGIGEGVMCRIGYFLSYDSSIGACLAWTTDGWMVRFGFVGRDGSARADDRRNVGGRMATKRDEAEDASSADDACALTPSEGAGD
jgi:hypothetical protein